MDSRRTARRRTRAARSAEPDSAATSRQTDRSPHAFVYALGAVLLVTAVVHARAFHNPFLFFDDPQNVLDNTPIRAITPENLRTYFTTPLLGMYSPLVYLSFAIDYRIGAFDTTAYHATNLALHLLNVVFVAFVVRRLIGHSTAAVLVAALFALHPLNVAAVTPISVRSSLLYSLFYLAALLAYLSYISRRQRGWLAVALLCFVLAGLSKSAAVVFPAVLVLVDLHLGREMTRTAWVEKIPFVLVASAFAVLAVVFRTDIGSIQDFSLAERTWLVLYSLGHYVFQLIMPIGLSPFHPYPARVDGHLPWSVYAAAVGFVAVAVLAWFWKSKRRLLAFGALFFLVNIALVLKVLPLGVEFLADRYVYLSSIGLLIVVVELVRAGRPAFRPAAAVVFGAIVVWFSTASYLRAADWRDRLTFETRILQRYPDDADAHAGLGIALADRGRLDEAVSHFTRAAELDPANADTRVNLCAALQKLGRFEDAVRAGREAVRLRPEQADAHTNLAAALEALGQTDDAAAEYSTVVRLAPASGEAHTNLGRVLLADDHRRLEAVAELREGLRLGPERGSTRYLLGNALAALGRLNEGVAEYEKALEDPDLARSPELHNDLGVTLARLGRTDAAVVQFKEALRLDPTFEAARTNLTRTGR